MPLNHIEACLLSNIPETVSCLEHLTVYEIEQDLGIGSVGGVLVAALFAYRWWKKRR